MARTLALAVRRPLPDLVEPLRQVLVLGCALALVLAVRISLIRLSR